MKVRVPVINTVGKSVSIEADAPSRAEMNAAIAAAIALQTATSSSTSVVSVIWRFIREVPQNIVNLALLASGGLVTRQTGGGIVARSIAVADTSRLTVADASGDAGNPTLDMADISARSVWARSANTDGKPAALQSSGDKAVLNQSGTSLSFATIDNSYISDFTEAAQDAVGSALTDTSTIDFTYNDGAGTISAIVIDNSITFAKLVAASAASVLVGRQSGSSGNFGEIVLGTNLSMSGSTLNATGGGGAYVFVNTATVAGAAATTLTISSLDLDTDSSYVVRIELKNNTTSAADISLYFNSDTTAGNYDTEGVSFSATAITSARINSARVGSQVAASASVSSIEITVRRSVDGTVAVRSIANYGNTISIVLQQWAMRWRTANTNVTGMTVSSSVASSLAIGSYIKVWKIAG